jgi:hypothetical protein
MLKFYIFWWSSLLLKEIEKLLLLYFHRYKMFLLFLSRIYLICLILEVIFDTFFVIALSDTSSKFPIFFDKLYRMAQPF